MKYGVVAIGRNEGERLKQCIRSVSTAAVVVYVDSGSSDGSAQWAREHGASVIELDEKLAFTAARARNVGIKRLQEIDPDLPYVQFADGDCELMEGWCELAGQFLESNINIAAVCGRLRERFPRNSIYNWLCDREWDRPSGEVHSCAGNVMMRVEALRAVGGYREDVIAGEEGELCFRLRSVGWRIWRLQADMALHDAAMTQFKQWWRRAVRGGYAFAQGAYLHGASKEKYCVWESRRAWIWGVWLPLMCLGLGLVLGPWGWASWLIYPFQMLRQMVRNPGKIRDRAMLSLFQLLGRFPEGIGQIRFLRDRALGRQARLIEYK